jgi:hypothetical protein
MDAEVLTFDEALALAADASGKCHALLGNGFSIACRPDCFTYDALLDEATFAGSSCDMREVFKVLERPTSRGSSARSKSQPI